VGDAQTHNSTAPYPARRLSSVSLAKMLPLAFVMIAGPQILSAIFLATSENWRRT